MKALAYTRVALKDLKGLPKADAMAIRMKIVSFAAGEPQDVTKLKGLDLYRLRHGDWRALLTVTETEITVARVRHRPEAYRS
jgi:mRNA-degrading endonuclease RelE of RelBE toxin-antitoxin system